MIPKGVLDVETADAGTTTEGVALEERVARLEARLDELMAEREDFLARVRAVVSTWNGFLPAAAPAAMAAAIVSTPL